MVQKRFKISVRSPANLKAYFISTKIKTIIYIYIYIYWYIPGLSGLADETLLAPPGKRVESGYLPGGRREARPLYQSRSCNNQLKVPTAIINNFI